MKILQPRLRRGKRDDRAGMVLLFGLLTILAAAIVTGVSALVAG